ncbi:hypothetical protein BLNAU_6646 [Blattamonas nauphoetae]|uniref:Uncharacterized protein n=1 Tax=Blattamonas nauphoetae TaxID=2049346 RepID=A0ABQ9Y3Q3_9EUKA|nr:hypothetical protein BLNAU_6646 [Blattamonas nauphoetae]
MFTNEQQISDDEILPISSFLFRDVRVSERPIPSFPRTIWELNEHPTIDTEIDTPRSANADVSTKPRISPISFHSLLFEITTDDSVVDSSDVDGEIRIGLVHGNTSILLSDINSMLLDTISSLGDLPSFFCCLPSAELSIGEKCIHFNDNVELFNENMELPKWNFGSVSRGIYYEMELSIRMIPGRLACNSFIVHASKHKNVRVLKPNGKERMSLGIQVVANHRGRVNTHVTLESSTQKIEIPIKCQIVRSVDRNGNHNYTSQHNNSNTTPIVSLPLPKTDFVPCSFNITLEHISTPLNSLPSDSPALGSNTLSTPTLPVLAKSVPRRVQFATLPGSKLYSGKATGQNPNMRPTNPLLSRWSENDSENEFDDLDELTEEMMRATPSLTGTSKSRPHTPSFGGNWGNEKAGTPTLGIRESGNQNCVLDSSEVASPRL